jgi:hypothetical protein
MSTLPDETFAFLVVHSDGQSNLSVRHVADFLNAIEEAYNGLLVFENLLESYGSVQDERMRRTRLRDIRRFGQLLTTRESLRRATLVIDSRSRLRIEGIEVGSPDFWSFIGKAIPFETIRQFLQDRHERRKDREYKESAEERKLELDNEMKEEEIEERKLSNELKRIEVFDSKIEIAKKLGATEKDLEPLLRNLFYKPLKRLDKFHDIIESVDVMNDEDAPDLPSSNSEK